MAYIFKQPKRPKKMKTKESAEILQKLENYLNSNIEVPVKFLCRFFEDQQNVISYQEIRQAILEEELSEDMLAAWRQDYSILVSTKMIRTWENALEAGSVSQSITAQFDKFEFNLISPEVKKWIKERGASFITMCSNEQIEAMKTLLNYKDNYTIEELSRIIRPCIGLTKPQIKANLNYYNHIKNTLTKEHPRMKKESIQRKAREAAVKYAEKQHRYRAYDIAQTEMAFAYNKGTDEGIRQAQEQKLIGQVIKRWCTSGDGNVCDICKQLEGIEIEMDEEFEFKGKVLFSGHKRTPPAHPRCACAVQYIEIAPPNL